MWVACASGGAGPCQRQTTMGTSQISHSAIQHTSSSWNQGVMRAARQSSQWGDFVGGGTASVTRVGRRGRGR